MSRVFWDTNLFIYLFEGHGERTTRVRRLRERMLERRDELCASTLTLGEILVKPTEEGRETLRQQYQNVLTDTVRLIPFDRDAAIRYAAIRSARGVRAPDAIQLACAAEAEVDLFITNDDRLSRLSVPGIEFVVSLERTPI